MDQHLLVKILYGAASFQGIFLSFLLFRSKINRAANHILAILLFLISFHLVLVGFDNREFFMTFPHLSRISWIIGSLYGPLIFLFVIQILKVKDFQSWKKVLLFTPFFGLLILMVPYYSLSAEEKRSIIDNFEKASLEDFGYINQFVSLLHFFYQGLCLFYYLRFEKKLRDEYSEIESVRIKWLKQFLLLVLAAVVLGVGAFFGRVLHSPVIGYLYNFHFLGVVFLFYWVSFKALTHPVLFGLESQTTVASLVAIPAVDEKYAKSTISDETLSEIFRKVQSVLKSERLYTDPGLTLANLASRIEIPKHYLSQSINSKFDGNFFDLINHYRIEEFKRLALDPSKKHLNILGVAQEAGFNSKASFYAIFKKKTGMTPAAFVESQSRPGNLSPN